MTNITHSISVDIQKHAKRQVVYMKQGDAMSRELTISFYNDGAVWALPNDVTVLQLAYCKEDFVGGCYDHMPDNTAAFTINTGRTSATMKIHPQVLTVAGNVICELRLLNASAHVLNTFNFVINVEKSPIAMTSSSEGYYNNVFDGATFVPHVSDAGILSWTNDKGLPNPDPIDLKEFVVDPSDIPVVPMEVVTSENAADNTEADDKLITPAAVKKLIDMYGADALMPPIIATMAESFSPAYADFDSNRQYNAGDGCIRGGKVCICKAAGHKGTWDGSHFEQTAALTDLSISDVSHLLTAAANGCGKVILAGSGMILSLSQFDSTSGLLTYTGISAVARNTPRLIIVYDLQTKAVSNTSYSCAAFDKEPVT